MQQLQPLPHLYSNPASACAVCSGLSLITLEQRCGLHRLDLVGQTFLAVARLNIEVLLISKSSSDGNFCFVIPQEHVQTLASSLHDELVAQLDEDSGLVSPTPNPSPVKREGLPEPHFPFPSLRGEGAGVRGISHQVDVLQADSARQDQLRLRIVKDVILLTASHRAHAGPVSAAGICSALAKQNINILVVAQGGSSVSLIIDAENANRAIDALNRL